MSAITKKRAPADGGAKDYIVDVFSSTNAGAGWVYRIHKNKALYDALSGGEQSAIDTAAAASGLDALSFEA